MGIDAHVAPKGRKPHGEVFDSKGYFVSALLSGPLDDTVCLRFIDPYGDTVFNGLQMPVLLDELEDFAARLSDANPRGHVEQLATLVRGALEMGPGVYLQFVGD